MRRSLLAISLLILVLTAVAYAGPTTPATLEGYLAKLKLKPQQPTPGEYQFSLGFPGTKPEKFLVRAMPDQKIVYVAIVDVTQIPVKGPYSDASFRKLAELNFKLTIGKLEWEPLTGEVRLSHTFANEQGVDYPSFVAVIQTLLTEVEVARTALKNAM
jgi:hypothetical protein